MENDAYIGPGKLRSRYGDLSLIENKVDLFHDQIFGWHLNIALQITNADGTTPDQWVAHANYAALQIVMAYPETIAKYWHGFTGRQSDEYFYRGMCLIYPQIDRADPRQQKALETLYFWSRCAMYHGTLSRVEIPGDVNAPDLQIDPDREIMAINVHQFIPTLINHFRGYCQMLKDPANVERRTAFLTRFDHDHII
jgi:hypothetical protein